MLQGFITLLTMFGGIVPAEMSEIVADRLDKLDKLVIEFSVRLYIAPSSGSFLDPSGWRPVGDISYDHRLTIVRPNVLDENLTDRPDLGFEPVLESVFDGTFAREYVRPNRFGRATYTVCDHAVQLGTFKWTPLLQVFDIHIQDSAIAQLNLARLFGEHEVILVGSVGDVSMYRATVPMGAWTQHYEFDLSSAGTPIRFKTRMEFPQNPELEPTFWEMVTLATESVNGAELCTEAVVAVRNPNVVDHYGVHHFVVSSYRNDPSLTAESVQITPDPRNASITVVRADGMLDHQDYDNEGRLERSQITGGPSPIDPKIAYVPRDSLRWRMAIPPVALAVGLTVACALFFSSRRKANTM